MSQPNTNDSFRLAFLTAIELPDRGHVGGLLVTNQLGRPLEFQCTAPVKANRTQEILYGPTLVPYVLCDLIGRTLLEKVSVKPQLVLVDDPSLLAVREQVRVPVAVCTPAGEAGPGSATQLRLFSSEQAARDEGAGIQDSRGPDGPAQRTPADAASRHGSPVVSLGRRRIALHPAYAADALVIDEARRRLPGDADLGEPFERVREALRETLGAAA